MAARSSDLFASTQLGMAQLDTGLNLAFFGLLWRKNRKTGEGCRVAIAPSIVFGSGEPSRWYFTSETKGEVMKKHERNTLPSKIAETFGKQRQGGAVAYYVTWGADGKGTAVEYIGREDVAAFVQDKEKNMCAGVLQQVLFTNEGESETVLATWKRGAVTVSESSVNDAAMRAVGSACQTCVDHIEAVDHPREYCRIESFSAFFSIRGESAYLLFPTAILISRKRVDETVAVYEASSSPLLFRSLVFNDQVGCIEVKKEKQLPIKKDTVCIFGYGSLIAAESRARTGNIISALPALVRGIHRSWCASYFRMTAVGAIDAEKGEVMGVIVEIPRKELASFDERETGYTRRLVKPEDVQFLPFPVQSTHLATGVEGSTLQLKIQRGEKEVYVYTRKTESQLQSPIAQTYIDVILSGCLQVAANWNESEEKEDEEMRDFGRSFARQFLITTGGWDADWVFDRDEGSEKLYSRALDSVPLSNEIDKLLEEIVPVEYEKARSRSK